MAKYKLQKKKIPVFFASVLACAASFAQFDGGMMAGYGSAMATVGLNAMNTQLLLGSMPSSSVSRSKQTTRLAQSLQPTQVEIQPSSTPRTIAKLASVYPEQQRTVASSSLRKLLDSYREVETHFGIPRYDLAGAVAMFIGGSYEAYHDVSLEPEQFKQLVSQMRQIIGTNPDFAKASNAEKQDMYEQMAILGMLMSSTQEALSQKPDPRIATNMKQAAKGYLEQFLKTDADRVQITTAGLVIR